MTMKSKKKIVGLIVFFAVFLAAILYVTWNSTALELNTYTITNKTLPKAFAGYRIAHISDLHNTQIGDDNQKLLAVLNESQPDIIAITGDMIDSRNTNIETALQFAEDAMKIAPCFYVTGNHEARILEYDELKNGLAELGVIVLENRIIEIEENNESIILIGVDDPTFHTDYMPGESNTIIENCLQALDIKQEPFTVLLSHRPELFDIYTENNIDLVLSGHAHGGQFRLPFIGALYAPNQGLFPKYDSGLYTQKDTSMIISRGIGNSIIPFRFNNRPEVIIIELMP